ncbi:hypothetical protein PTTG_30942, partial [Puccinia triticina 1-1 BBBD Race 1]
MASSLLGKLKFKFKSQEPPLTTKKQRRKRKNKLSPAPGIPSATTAIKSARPNSPHTQPEAELNRQNSDAAFSPASVEQPAVKVDILADMKGVLASHGHALVEIKSDDLMIHPAFRNGLDLSLDELQAPEDEQLVKAP